MNCYRNDTIILSGFEVDVEATTYEHIVCANYERRSLRIISINKATGRLNVAKLKMACEVSFEEFYSFLLALTSKAGILDLILPFPSFIHDQLLQSGTLIALSASAAIYKTHLTYTLCPRSAASTPQSFVLPATTRAYLTSNYFVQYDDSALTYLKCCDISTDVEPTTMQTNIAVAKISVLGDTVLLQGRQNQGLMLLNLGSKEQKRLQSYPFDGEATVRKARLFKHFDAPYLHIELSDNRNYQVNIVQVAHIYPTLLGMQSAVEEEEKGEEKMSMKKKKRDMELEEKPVVDAADEITRLNASLREAERRLRDQINLTDHAYAIAGELERKMKLMEQAFQEEISEMMVKFFFFTLCLYVCDNNELFPGADREMKASIRLLSII